MKKRYRLLRLPILLITFSLACTESKIEPGLKLIVISGPRDNDSPPEVTEFETDEKRTWLLPAEVGQGWVRSVSAGPGGQLLLVGEDGVIGVVSGEETKEYTQIAEDGLVAAWSNDGQQIAIVHEIPQEDPSSTQTSLEILDKDFQQLWTETIDLPVDEYGSYPGCLSWSADDRLLAISRQSPRPGSYLIVDVHTRKVFPKDGYNSVFFIGSRTLAGKHYTGEDFQERTSEIQVAQVDLQADSVEILSPTTIVSSGPVWVGVVPSYDLLVSASSNPARLVIWKADIWVGFPYATNGTCSILDEQGNVLAERLLGRYYISESESFCLTRSSEAE